MLFIFFICFLFIGEYLAPGQTGQNHQGKMQQLPYPFSTVAEYDPLTSLFYGRLRMGEFDYFASIHSITGERILLDKLPSYDGWGRGASALDIKNHRFFFIAYLKGKQHLIVVDTKNGQVINSAVLSQPIRAIEFDPSSGKLLGLSTVSGTVSFVSFNPSTASISTISKISLVKRIHPAAYLDTENHKYFFIGSWKDSHYVCVVDTKSGMMKTLSGKYVGLNKYTVKSFKKDKTPRAIFTSGVHSCTGIAGYDSQSDIGFIAHFSPKYKRIEPLLSKIDKEIKTINNKRGLQHMKLFVVGGVRTKHNSVNNLMTVYTQLVKQYNVNYDEITRFNTGISYNIVIYNTKVKVF